jgi:Mn-dependent DtxR family transcriptional regulator
LISQPSVTEMVRRLVDDGLVVRDDQKLLRFTPEGREIAQRVVSRHRLLEAFLTEVFEIPWDEVHEEAHSLEHRLSESVERRMYAMMSQAHQCPHGHPIGNAPREAGRPLTLVPDGSVVTVLRFENEDGDLLRTFRRAGLEPGARYVLKGTSDGRVRFAAADGGDVHVLEAPVAGTDYDFRTRRAIGGLVLDNAFSDLERDADGVARVELRDLVSGAGRTLWMDEAYPYVMVFSGDPLPDVARRALAVEPMSCPPNAFRSGESLVRLAPGESHTATWGISV